MFFSSEASHLIQFFRSVSSKCFILLHITCHQIHLVCDGHTGFGEYLPESIYLFMFHFHVFIAKIQRVNIGVSVLDCHRYTL